MAEAEPVFFNQPLLVTDDTKHSQGEYRFHALGKTNEDRAFWEQHDSTDYLDWTKAQQIVLPNRLLRYGYRKNCIASNDGIADG